MIINHEFIYIDQMTFNHWDYLYLWEKKLLKPPSCEVIPESPLFDSDDDPWFEFPFPLPIAPEIPPNKELKPPYLPWLFPPVSPPKRLPSPLELLPPPKSPWALFSMSIGPDCCYFPINVLTKPLTDSGNNAVQSPLISWRVYIGFNFYSGLNRCYCLKFILRPTTNKT